MQRKEGRKESKITTETGVYCCPQCDTCIETGPKEINIDAMNGIGNKRAVNLHREIESALQVQEESPTLEFDEALLAMAEDGDLAGVTEFISSGLANINARMKSRGNITALMLAVASNRRTVVKFLLEAGADVRLCATDGKTALDLAVSEDIRSLILPFVNAAAASSQNICAACGAASKFRCTKCKAVTYCGAECQKRHWKTHKQACGSSSSSG